MLHLSTSRLNLIAATPGHVEAEVHDRAKLSRLLNAQVPDDWPPPLNDDKSMQWTLRYLRDNPDAIGWTMWYFILRDGPDGKPIAVGNGGFKGKPSTGGIVEVGYSIMENHQGNGYATEAVSVLIGWAFMHPEVNKIIVHTLPGLTASIRVVEKIGFSFVGKGSEEGTIRCELFREAFEQDTSF